MIQPCSTCPWLRSNHQKKHKAGWYTLGNLRRLWNGLRTGRAPGMVCHSTDPTNVAYGGDKIIQPDTKPHECVGATILVQKELNILNSYRDFRKYRRDRPHGLTRPGLAMWVTRVVFGGGVPCGELSADVALPWIEEKTCTGSVPIGEPPSVKL